jgi:hypothetical protein
MYMFFGLCFALLHDCLGFYMYLAILPVARAIFGECKSATVSILFLIESTLEDNKSGGVATPS